MNTTSLTLNKINLPKTICYLSTIGYADSCTVKYEGLTSERILRLLKKSGYTINPFITVSDDTEHNSLLLQSILNSTATQSNNPIRLEDRFGNEFRRLLAHWYLSIPPHAGFATVKSGFKNLLGLGWRKTGVFSAGNAPLMRVGVISTIFDANFHLNNGASIELFSKYIFISTFATHTDVKATYATIFSACLGQVLRTANLELKQVNCSKVINEALSLADICLKELRQYIENDIVLKSRCKNFDLNVKSLEEFLCLDLIKEAIDNKNWINSIQSSELFNGFIISKEFLKLNPKLNSCFKHGSGFVTGYCKETLLAAMISFFTVVAYQKEDKSGNDLVYSKELIDLVLINATLLGGDADTVSVVAAHFLACLFLECSEFEKVCKEISKDVPDYMNLFKVNSVKAGGACLEPRYASAFNSFGFRHILQMGRNLYALLKMSQVRTTDYIWLFFTGR